MLVNLDISEMCYLLDTCLRGSHHRASTIRRFVDDWFDRLSDQERYELYEWALRITFSYEKEFTPSDRCCGADIEFMCRYDPENQFMITTQFEGKTEKFLAFSMNNKYYVKSNRFIAEEYITIIEHYIPRIIMRTEFEENFTGRRH